MGNFGIYMYDLTNIFFFCSPSEVENQEKSGVNSSNFFYT